MDFSFVESLLKNGASVKSSDKHGQTIFHEVARSWHTDVAQFLITQGNNSFGRGSEIGEGREREARGEKERGRGKKESVCIIYTRRNLTSCCRVVA